MQYISYHQQGEETDTPTPTPTLSPTPTSTETASLTPSPTATNTPVPSTPITIEYIYDDLYRLTEANYSTGDYYHYEYDAVGNRLTESNQSSVTSYVYDDANRIYSRSLGETTIYYSWDNNGNLIYDASFSHIYDAANRLVTRPNLSSPTVTFYRYNGLGDRLQEGVYGGSTVTYTMDLNAGLTQVLDDGTNTYLYGLGRISQTDTATEYFLGDALGSVRQLADESGAITLAKSYQPYGRVMSSSGSGISPFAFTGEMMDASGLVYLRARYYSATMSRFLSRDPFPGYSNLPQSQNPFIYGLNNPIRYADPSGENPLAFVAALAGVIGLGGIAGGIYGCISYEWALTGQCGCDIQQAALSMSKSDWVSMYILLGGFTAGLASVAVAAAAVEPLAAVIVGGAAIGFAVWDGIDLLNIVYEDGVGWTPCNITRAALDLSLLIFGTTNLINGLRAFSASGSWLKWDFGVRGGPMLNRPGYSGP